MTKVGLFATVTSSGIMPEPWGKSELDEALAIWSKIQSPGFVFATWPKFEPDAKGVYHMPYPTYHPAVEQLFNIISGIHPYDPLPEDGEKKGIGFGDRFETTSFTVATVDQIRRYFAYCRRAERFCDGYWEGQFDSGVLGAAMDRLRKLRTEVFGLS